MAFKMKRPLKMAGPKPSGLKLGRKMKNANIDNQISGDEFQSGDTGSGLFYNSDMGPMKMVSPSALKQMQETATEKTEQSSSFMPTEPKEGGGDKNIGLLPSEMEGTYVYEGNDINERIIDYDERISFIEEDVWNMQEGPADAPVDMSQATPQQQKDHATLTAAMKKLEQQRGSNKDRKKNIKPGYDEQGNRDETMDEQY